MGHGRQCTSGIITLLGGVELSDNMYRMLHSCNCIFFVWFQPPDLDLYVTWETLQADGVWTDYRRLILFRLIMMVLLLMSLVMILMPMEPSVCSFMGAPF
jgi:hypothetical protein